MWLFVCGDCFRVFVIVFTRRKGKEDTVGKRKRSLRERKGTDKDRRKKGFGQKDWLRRIRKTY